MSRKDNLQGLLTERFQNFEAEPQIDLWKGIEAELYPQKQKSRKLWPYFSIAASIVILFFAWNILNNPAGLEQTKGENLAEEKVDLPQVEAEAEDELLSPQEESQSNLALEEKPKPETQSPKKQQQPVKQPFAPVLKAKDMVEDIDMAPARDLVENAVAVSQDLQQPETPKETKDRLIIDPLGKELIVMNSATVEQPKATKISVEASEPPAELSEENTDRGLIPKDLSFSKLMSMASNGIDKLKKASPVKVYEEKNEKGESKVYELNLFKFSVSHKTQKRRNKKVRL